MAKELTWNRAISKVLGESSEPLHYREITDRIIADQLRTKLGVKPAATVIGQITASIRKLGAESPYVRVDAGTFALRKAGPPRSLKSDQDDGQYAVVSSFGMFWRREAVEWVRTPKLLGMQQIGAEPVDFAKQFGIYLLYDGREVIYVGRSTDRPLGTRLFEHTLDRLSVRWDRFSWFGFLPVSDAGALGPLPTSFDATTTIPAFEAILIEALEPRQNRKRGDDLAAVEYLQHEDPAIRKRHVKETLDTLLSKM